MTGTHLALSREDAKLVFGRREPHTLRELLCDELLSRPAGETRRDCEDWERLHRILTDGSMSSEAGEYPLNQCFLGGRPLDAGGTSVVNMVRPDSVPHVAAALQDFAAESVSSRLEMLPPDYRGARDEEAAAQVATDIAELAEFFRAAAEQQQAVLFVSLN